MWKLESLKEKEKKKIDRLVLIDQRYHELSEKTNDRLGKVLEIKQRINTKVLINQ